MPRTGAFREQWAAPPRTSVKDRDGVPQKGPPREQSRCRMWHGCMARSTALEHGKGQEERASWGTYNAARGAWRRHYLICEAFFRRSAPSNEGNRRPAAPARLFDNLGPKGRGTNTCDPSPPLDGTRLAAMPVLCSNPTE